MNPPTSPTLPGRRPGAIVPARLAHLVFRTPRYERMVAWYCEVLQAERVFSDAMLTFVTYDEEHHRLAFVNLPQLADLDPTAAGVDHVAFTYASMPDLLHTYERLKASGILPVWCINHGPTTSMYYADPDGTRVELQIDNFPDQASLDAWFRSGAFAKNPIGVEFEPDVLVRLFHAGVPLEKLVQQGSTAAG